MTVDADAAGPLAVTVTVEAGPVCVTVEAATEAAGAVTVIVVGAAVVPFVTYSKTLESRFRWELSVKSPKQPTVTRFVRLIVEVEAVRVT